MRGQEIDCAVTEAMMRTLDFLAIEYDQLGAVRTQTGNRSQYAAPGNIYATKDGKWASIAASTQSIYERFCRALGLDHLITDPRFIDNPVAGEELARDRSDRGGCDRQLTLDELRDLLHAHEVGFSPIYDASDIFADPHFSRARDHRQRARRRAGRCAHAMRGAALLGDTGRGAPRRAVARPAQ